MAYELWDTETGNLLGVFQTEAEALSVVHATVTRYKSRQAKRIEWLSLYRSDAPAGQALIANGAVLAGLARSAATSVKPAAA